MQMVVDSFRAKGKLFKKMQEVEPRELGIRNKIKMYKATDINGYFWAMIVISQKSRILIKDVEKYDAILAKLVLYFEHNFKYKVLFIEAPLCSKAKDGFKQSGWKLY